MCIVFIYYQKIGTQYAQGGGTLIFSYIVGSVHFFGLKILNFDIFLGF